MSDPNLLTLFGSILGIIGSLLLSVDALGAPDFLAALKTEQEKGIRMTHIGFLALINRTFIYLAVSVISLIVILLVSRGNIVLSLIISPFPYFGWRLLRYITDTLFNFIRKLSPRDYIKGRRGCVQKSMGCAIFLLHWLIWAIPFLIIFMLATFVRFGLDLPLTYISEKAMVPIVKRLYELSAKVIAEEQRWHFKKNALFGSILIFFGFSYQFIGTLILIKWW